MRSKWLSHQQRVALLEHIDGLRPIHRPHNNRPTLRGLAARGLIEWVPRYSKRPTHTTLSEEGRAALAAVLADYAETLSRAGVDVVAELLAKAIEKATKGTDSPPELLDVGAVDAFGH